MKQMILGEFLSEMEKICKYFGTCRRLKLLKVFEALASLLTDNWLEFQNENIDICIEKIRHQS